MKIGHLFSIFNPQITQTRLPLRARPPAKPNGFTGEAAWGTSGQVSQIFLPVRVRTQTGVGYWVKFLDPCWYFFLAERHRSGRGVWLPEMPRATL